MNYYEARELMDKATGKGIGKWRYTCMCDKQIWAVGYCAQDCPGHDTAEDAYEHYRQYILDKTEYDSARLSLNPDKTPSQLPCVVCGVSSNGHIIETAFPQRAIFNVCLEHCNKESLAKVLEVGVQWSSW